MDALGAVLDEAAAPVDVAEAEAVARTRFGVAGTARLLTGERDHNFHLLAQDGRQFVLKLVHPAEDPGVTAFQSAALLQIARTDPGLPTPRLFLPLGQDDPECIWQPPGGPARRVRLLSYLDGTPLHLLAPSAARRRHVGACLARLDLALAGVAHPSDRHPLLWDLQHAAQVRPLLDDLPAGRRALPLHLLDRFAAETAPVLGALRRQVIHNDFNPHNLLADAGGEAIAGIIDFGDMVRAPLVQDLATAAAYQIPEDGHVLAGPADVAGGFHARCPLQEAEICVLASLIATRLVLTIAISSWRARRHPDNAAYILRNQPLAWAGLERLAALGPGEARDVFHAACQRPANPEVTP